MANPRRHIATPFALTACAMAATFVFPAQQALALGSDTVFIRASAGLTYDSNLFRLDSGVNPSTGEDHQDTFIIAMDSG